VKARKTIRFNADTGEFGDMVKAGVIDPASHAPPLQNAASIAGLMLTTEALADIREDNKQARRRR